MRRIALPLLLLLAADTSAEPMNLGEDESRWIHVQFEHLGADQLPADANRFSRKFTGRLEAQRDGRVRVSVSGAAVEEMMRREDPEVGSFSDFVWTFDRASGEVESAVVTGVLEKTVDFGLFENSVDAAIEIRVNTLVPAGFGESRMLLGHELPRFCSADDAASDDGCTLIEPLALDPVTGVVRAVGSLSAKTSFIRTETLAPLGTAIFSEVPSEFVGPLAGGL